MTAHVGLREVVDGVDQEEAAEVNEVEEAVVLEVAVDAEVQEDVEDLVKVLCPIFECEFNICFCQKINRTKNKNPN